MEDNKNINTLNKLIELTKEKKLKWDRLFNILDDDGQSHSNQLLNKFLVKNRNDYSNNNCDVYQIDKSESYVSEHSNGYIYIFSFKEYNWDDQYISIAIQSSNIANVVILNDTKELQAEIKRLVFLIEEDINNVDGFISSLFD
ncbi:MAG: hypothetical protein ACYDEX_24860 [Mobilitalea sp.]